jgi:hypothetical protein
MSGSDSISNSVARRISYTGSYPSARGSAPTQLGLCMMTWLVGPTMLTCQLTGRLHGMPTGHADVTIMSCWCHPYPGQSCGSGYLVFGSGLPFGWRRRVARVWRVGARGHPPLRRVLARAGMSHVRILRRFHQWLHLFLLYTVVWSKHNFDNIHFWAKIKHHFKP